MASSPCNPDLDAAFEARWDAYAARLLDREQQALLRCLRDAPEKVLGLFDYYIELSAGRPNLDEPALAPLRYRPPGRRSRRCVCCGGRNTRQRNKLCYACYRARYERRRGQRVA